MALDLLLNVFKLPLERLVITYFDGDEELNLSKDKETEDVWLSIG